MFQRKYATLRPIPGPTLPSDFAQDSLGGASARCAMMAFFSGVDLRFFFFSAASLETSSAGLGMDSRQDFT